MLRLVFNTFTADEKYSLLNRDNLTQTIYIQLSQKQKTFSGIFFAVLKFILNFEHFSKKMTHIRHVFPKLRSLRNVVT